MDKPTTIINIFIVLTEIKDIGPVCETESPETFDLACSDGSVIRIDSIVWGRSEDVDACGASDGKLN